MNVDFQGAYAHITPEGVTLEPRGERQLPHLTVDDLAELYDRAREQADMVRPITSQDAILFAQEAEGFPWRGPDGKSLVWVTDIATYGNRLFTVRIYDGRSSASYVASTRGELKALRDRLWRWSKQEEAADASKNG